MSIHFQIGIAQFDNMDSEPVFVQDARKASFRPGLDGLRMHNLGIKAIDPWIVTTTLYHKTLADCLAAYHIYRTATAADAQRVLWNDIDLFSTAQHKYFVEKVDLVEARAVFVQCAEAVIHQTEPSAILSAVLRAKWQLRGIVV